MKNYIKPEILEEMIECEDICAASTLTLSSNWIDDNSQDSGDLPA